MKTFSCLSLFTLVCFGIALMLFGSTADAQDLTFGGNPATGQTYDTGTPVTVSFLIVDASGDVIPNVNATLTGNLNNQAPANGAVTFNALGQLKVTGNLITGNNYVEVNVPTVELTAKAEYMGEPKGISPAVIVVNPPDPKSELKIDDTFTQVITIENRKTVFSTLPLSAWQMDVVFNPLILEVIDVAEGGFLESDGEDAVFIQMTSSGKISVSQARAGQMANADPALPNVAKAPSPAGIALAPGDTGELLTITFRVLAVSEEALGIHNVKLQSDKDDNEDGTPDRISYSILVTDVFVATHMSSAKEDVNQDGEVNIQDLVMVAGSIGMTPPNPRADVNSDGSVNVLDLVAIYTSDLWATSVDSKKVNDANDAALTAPSTKLNVNAATIQSWIDLAQVEDDGSVIFEQGIANLEALLTSQIPSQTKLLLNYPNPFNPETWIPYQLAKASDVTVMIHSMNGSLIRTLELGHQTAGIYKSKSHAAYWDGHNELGEHVASGLYFYTLTAGKFSATGKMLVRK